MGMKVKRGEVYVCDFGGILAADCNRKQYALVIQNNCGNNCSSTTIVALIRDPYTSEWNIPSHYVLSDNPLFDSQKIVQLEQIHTVSKLRLIKKIGYLNQYHMNQINKKILFSFGITSKLKY